MKSAWMENRRNKIAAALDAISTVIWLASLLSVRTLAGAGAMLAYFFFTASPDTTVYQLSQLAHLGVFWQGALCIAVVYSGFLVAIRGSFNGHSISQNNYACAAAGSASVKLAQSAKLSEKLNAADES